MSARQGLPRADLISGLNGPARTHAVYASPGRSPHRTQDSLPAVGQTLPGGLSVPLGSSERFLRCFLHRFPPFPGLTWRKRAEVEVTEAEKSQDFPGGKSETKPPPKERRDPLKQARYYQSMLDSGKFESRAALARYLGVSRPRVTQVLRRLR